MLLKRGRWKMLKRRKGGSNTYYNSLHTNHDGTSNPLERLFVQGKVEGTRERSRSPIRWTDQIKSEVEEKDGGAS